MKFVKSENIMHILWKILPFAGLLLWVKSGY